PTRNTGSCSHNAIVNFQSNKFSLRRVLQFRICDRQIDIFIVVSVPEILEESANHRGRYHVSDALRHVAAIALKRHADHFGVLHDWSTAIAWIDLRTDLNCEVRIDR